MENIKTQTPDAATGKPVMKIDFNFECNLFNMTMKHRAVEQFYVYVGLVKITSDEYKDTNRIGFEYKKDWGAEWVKYIVEKYCLDSERDEQTISEVEKYYNDNHFVNDFDIYYEIKEYAKENRLLIETRWESYDIAPDIYLTGILDMRNGIHKTASHIAGYTDAYRKAMGWDVVKYRGDVHIPMEIFDEGERDTLNNDEFAVKKLVCYLGKMVDDLEVKKDEVVVYIDK